METKNWLLKKIKKIKRLVKLIRSVFCIVKNDDEFLLFSIGRHKLLIQDSNVYINEYSIDVHTNSENWYFYKVLDSYVDNKLWED